jgi:hypothetical protein
LVFRENALTKFVLFEPPSIVSASSRTGNREDILRAVRQKLPRALARADFEMVALEYFRRLGHDNHHRLFLVYGWKEKKTKTSWGGNTVNHEKLAEARIHAMTAADLNRFMVTCALVSDLYCPGYSSAETLSKEANLIRTAVRYKVDASKITAGVASELSAKGKRGKSKRGLSARAGDKRRSSNGAKVHPV